MGFITKLKNKVRGVSVHDETSIDHQKNRVVEKILEPRRQFDDGYYSKGNWWDDEMNQEYMEEAFDQYAREYHSAETNEERYELYKQDRSWMIN